MILLFLSISFIIAKKTFLILLHICLEYFSNNVCYEKWGCYFMWDFLWKNNAMSKFLSRLMIIKIFWFHHFLPFHYYKTCYQATIHSNPLLRGIEGFPLYWILDLFNGNPKWIGTLRKVPIGVSLHIIPCSLSSINVHSRMDINS